MRCQEVREMLPAYAGGDEVSLPVRRHLAECPDCRAEFAGYESMLADLRSLQAVTAQPPDGLRTALLAIPSATTPIDAARVRVDSARAHVARNRKAYLGGLAVALAGAAGAAVWRSRARAAAA
ncbi:MAG: anti-sigma factor family protein [Actinomycetota bacterium]